MKTIFLPRTRFADGLSANRLALCCLSLLAAVHGLNAAPIVWQGGASGDFNTGSNWVDNNAPSGTDTAVFNGEGAVTVSFSAATTSFGQLDFQGTTAFGPPSEAPTLTLNLNDNEVTISENNAFSIFSTTSSGVRTAIINGGPLGEGKLNLGGTNNLQIGGVSVSDTNSLVRLENGVTVDLGNSGSIQVANSNSLGELQIVGGSTLIQRRGGVVGRINSANGTVTVSGAGSTWSMIGAGARLPLSIGGGAQGTLTIEDGGTVSSTGAINVGRLNNQSVAPKTGSGIVLITGEGSSISATEFYIGGGRGELSTADVLADGNGLVTFEKGASGTFSEILRTLATDVTKGTLVIEAFDGTQVSAATATFDPNSVLSFGLSQTDANIALDVSGVLTVTDATLEVFLAPGFSASIGDSFLLASYDSLVGTFANSTVVIDDYTFSVDYNFNSLSIIALTVIPEPAVQTGLFGLAALLCLTVSRRRRSRR